MAANTLVLNVETGDGMAVIHCHGELDMSVSDHLRAAIERVYTPGLAVIRIDTTGLSFMDSSGIHCLIETEQRCQEHGTRLEVIPSRPVARLLAIAGVADRFAGSLVAPGAANPELAQSGERHP